MKKRFRNIFLGKGMVLLISILAQIVWIFGLLFRLNRYYVSLTTILQIIGLILVISIIVNRDNPAFKLVWTVVIMTVPVLGVFLYFFVGKSSAPKKMYRRFSAVNEEFDGYKAQDSDILSELMEDNPSVYGQCKYLSDYSGYGAYKNTDITYFAETNYVYDALITELSKAEKYIFMEYFAYEDSVSFKRIEEILEKKAREGVEVRIIYDDYGSLGYFKKDFIARLKGSGVKIRVFNPLVPILYVFMNTRDHRKITVIDGRVSFNGGFNMCDEYFNISSPFGYWKDAAVMLKGDAVRNHIVMFLEMWNSIDDTDRECDWYFDVEPYKAEDGGAVVIPYGDSPLDGECVGENVYMNVIRHAKKYVYIFTPYLIIDNEMMEVLCLAAKSGVDVRIVTPNIPDKKLVFLVTKSYYPQLLDAGVRIYQYTPGFLHSKCYICDDEVGVVGSINTDFRSLYLNFEGSTFFYNSKALIDLKKDFMDTFEKSGEVLKKEVKKSRSVIVGALQAILRLFAPLM